MNTIKVATVCSFAAFCDAAYDLWGWDGVGWAALVLAGVFFIINRKWRMRHDGRS